MVRVAAGTPRGLRSLPAPRPQIIPAVDLGGVEVLKHGNLYLLTDELGDIHADGRGLGLYQLDTRILSHATLQVNGARPTVLRMQTGANFEALIQLTNPELRRHPADKTEKAAGLARRSLSIQRRRRIGGGLSETLGITNFNAREEPLVVELRFGFDAADIFEVRGHRRAKRGRCLPIRVSDSLIVFAYRGLDDRLRRTFIAFPPAVVEPVPRATNGLRTAAPDSGDVLVRWERRVPAGDRLELGWQVWTDVVPIGTGGTSQATRHAIPPPPGLLADDGGPAYASWHERSAKVDSDNELLDITIGRSIADLRLLINDGPRPGERYPAAGVPWFATLFGRDAIITALETLAFLPDLATETLSTLAALQATVVDETLDAEPGKILHELRSGEMARSGEIPHRPYYGSVDSTPLWLLLLAETFEWTGDVALVDRLWPNALRALAWIDDYGDLDGDGFVEYRRHAPGGLLNQGWKDSADAIRDRRGRPLSPPIALAEVQGYVYAAKRRIAHLARLRDEAALGARLDADADVLRDRFDAAFWVDDLGYYAMGLDADKQPADAIGSNAGQCLWTGIVPPGRVDAIVERLMGPGLNSGWGVRTYAADQPGYNPIGYHTGTVWPHDNALIAAGLKRYDRHEAANVVATSLFEAAQAFPACRLPELFCGFERAASGLPVAYPVACSPQAWSAGATLSFLRTMLGMRPSAHAGMLDLDRPHLPQWLGRVTVRELRVGDAQVDLLFHRWRGLTSAEVLRKTGSLDVVIHV
ncbi:MAG: amylo-alpha-1,6-glucosidase [Candidatus Limnocylindrales bacterium]